MTGDPATPQTHGAALFHEALFYRGKGELARAVHDFVTEGIEAGEPVLAAVPRENVEWLREALSHHAAEVRFEDMNEVGSNPSCLLPIIQEWIEDHDGRARVISEPMWPGRSYAEMVECLRHEALLNHALSGLDAKILCPYDAEHLDSDVLEGAELTHPRLRDASGSRPSERYEDPLRVFVGERWPLTEPAMPMSEHVFVGDLRSLRRAVVDDPSLRGLSRERREDVVFVVNEAATNVLKHGDGRCTARIWHDGHSVVSEVSSDTAVPDVLAGRRRPSPDALSGRGLWLINQVCDLVELRSSETGLTLRMHVR
jgi:anti-sigma regulatory factor (Ser/Thr protein kinase)